MERMVLCEDGSVVWIGRGLNSRLFIHRKWWRGGGQKMPNRNKWKDLRITERFILLIDVMQGLLS